LCKLLKIYFYFLAKSTVTTSNNAEKRKSINSEWYRALQKGAEIPEAGLATMAKGGPTNVSVGKSVTEFHRYVKPKKIGSSRYRTIRRRCLNVVTSSKPVKQALF